VRYDAIIASRLANHHYVVERAFCMARPPHKPNMTVTSRSFNDKSLEASRQISNPFPNPPPGRSAISRLGSRAPSPKLDWATADFVSYINGSLPDAVFFLDTGVFTRELDSAIWNALGARRVLITPGVCQELLPWLRNPFHNKAVRDAVASAAKTEFGLPTQTKSAANVNVKLLIPDDEFTSHGYNYYLQLLTLRKMMGPLASAILTKKLGRAPTQEEFHAEVQSQFGERGYLLAKKGLEGQNSKNRLTDEHLVVTAMLTAILEGSEVVIVTRDPDVLEQYAKLCTLMKEHYRAMLVAERYRRILPPIHSRRCRWFMRICALVSLAIQSLNSRPRTMTLIPFRGNFIL
jgi:hypothetical protein